MANLFPFFFGSLPAYFKVFDTNKDSQGRGSLERYLSVFQEEGEIIAEDIQSLYKAIFPKEAKEQHLDLISALWGFPALLNYEEEEAYRHILSVIPNILKYKGTKKGLVYYFKAWGFEVSFGILTSEGIRYDENHKYDEEFKYDGLCSYCAGFFMTLIPKTPLAGDIAQAEGFQMRVEEVLKYLLPIFIREVIIHLEWDYLRTQEGYLITSEYKRIIIYR